MVGVVVPRLQDYVLATIYEGIDEAAARRGYFTVVSNSLDVPKAHRAKAETFLGRRADGLIFGDAQYEDAFLEELAERGVPFTLVSRSSGSHPSVTCDDYTGGKLAAEHLVAAGRTSFGIIAGNPNVSTSINRTRGFLDTLEEHGLGVEPDNIMYDGFDAPAGSDAAARFLERGNPPEAIFAANDFAVLGAMGTFRRHGFEVPRDISLVGYNDTPLAESVGLTTVRSPMREMGQQGFTMLMDILAGKDVENIQLPPELIVRTSV